MPEYFSDMHRFETLGDKTESLEMVETHLRNVECVPDHISDFSPATKLLVLMSFPLL